MIALFGKIFAGAAGFFFDTRLGKAAAAGIVAVGLVAAFAWDQRARGAAGALVKVEKSNAKAVNDADRARARSRGPAARGVQRDPYAAD